MKNYTKEWCSVTLMNRFNICFKIEFASGQADLIMIGFKLRDGLAITMLGLSIGFDWKLTNKK